jgi:hypothetical protein
MARNLKKENLKKLSQIKTSNGFKIDLANYMYNPSFNHEYPNLIKVTGQTETEKFYTNVYYFKHHNGTGEYIMETYSHKIDPDSSWSIANNSKQTELESNNRFSLKHLIELAEKIEVSKENKIESISTIAAK